ncbi:MAG: 3-isopropylmalate dehydratase small subunit [Roseomonas sp.]|jgi:3-isopropylmalate/(R)-2-methylmalate dehydratase small subunit|nr:3-isopropylmalate dehydratase small subunit [Roseomonas sp.]
MRRFEPVTGVAALLDRDDIDTDQILPAANMRGAKIDYGAGLFANWRREPEFVLSQPRYARTRILVAGSNFGCGSTREHAAWALDGFGIRVILARGFGEVFRENCLRNALLPVTLAAEPHARLVAAVAAADGQQAFHVDLAAQRMTGPGDFSLDFDVAPVERVALLEGLDDIGLTLRFREAIAAHEAAQRQSRPWLQRMDPPGWNPRVAG